MRRHKPLRRRRPPPAAASPESPDPEGSEVLNALAKRLRAPEWRAALAALAAAGDPGPGDPAVLARLLEPPRPAAASESEPDSIAVFGTLDPAPVPRGKP